MKYYRVLFTVINEEADFNKPNEQYAFYHSNDHEISSEIIKQYARNKINEYPHLAATEFFETEEISGKEFNNFLVCVGDKNNKI